MRQNITIRVRLKDTEQYVPAKEPSRNLRPDGAPEPEGGFVSVVGARVWDSKASLRKSLGRLTAGKPATWSRYEAVITVIRDGRTLNQSTMGLTSYLVRSA